MAIFPLIDLVDYQNLTRKWYADDGNVPGSLESLRIVLDELFERGSVFVYNVIRYHLNTISNKFFGIRCWCYWGSSSSGFSYWFPIKAATSFWKKSQWTTLTCLRNSPDIVRCPPIMSTNHLQMDCNIIDFSFENSFQLLSEPITKPRTRWPSITSTSNPKKFVRLLKKLRSCTERISDHIINKYTATFREFCCQDNSKLPKKVLIKILSLQCWTILLTMTNAGRFYLPFKEGCLTILLPEDGANKLGKNPSENQKRNAGTGASENVGGQRSHQSKKRRIL